MASHLLKLGFGLRADLRELRAAHAAFRGCTPARVAPSAASSASASALSSWRARYGGASPSRAYAAAGAATVAVVAVQGCPVDSVCAETPDRSFEGARAYGPNCV